MSENHKPHWVYGCEPNVVHNSPSIPTYVGRTYNLTVNPDVHRDRKAQKSIVFNILASFSIFARVRILSRFFALYRGIRSAKRYKTVVQLEPVLRGHGDLLGRDEWPHSSVNCLLRPFHGVARKFVEVHLKIGVAVRGQIRVFAVILVRGIKAMRLFPRIRHAVMVGVHGS